MFSVKSISALVLASVSTIAAGGGSLYAFKQYQKQNVIKRDWTISPPPL